jgi:hypothetical protein
MPLPPVAGATPGPLPVVGQSSPPGAMPVGNAGGATLPAANRGLQAKGLTQVQTAVRILEQALPLLGADSDPGRDVIKALTSLSKHIPPGSTSPGVERTGLQTMMQQQRQDQPNIALLRALGQGGGGAGAPPPAAPPAAGGA